MNKKMIKMSDFIVVKNKNGARKTPAPLND
jgi:hypothetical protein